MRQTFKTKKEALSWESKVIQRMNAVKDIRWLNHNNSGKKFYCAGHSEETKQKMSVAKKRKTWQTAFRRNKIKNQYSQ